MRGMIGCAGIIAAVAFVLGLIGSLAAVEATIFERLLIALMPAAMAFVAAIVLFLRDHSHHTSTVQRVRQGLLNRENVGESDFLAAFPHADSTILLQVRQAVSQFFDVPADKIHPQDELGKDFAFDQFEPALHTFVCFHVFAARNVEVRPYTFRTGELKSLGDLCREVERVLLSFGPDADDRARP